jgi:hypothetical protein
MCTILPVSRMVRNSIRRSTLSHACCVGGRSDESDDSFNSYLSQRKNKIISERKKLALPSLSSLFSQKTQSEATNTESERSAFQDLPIRSGR